MASVRPAAPELRRICAAAGLLALGAIGVRALAGLWSAPSGDVPAAAALTGFAALEATALVLLVAALRGRRGGTAFGRWTRPLTVAFVLLVLAAPGALLAAAAGRVAHPDRVHPLPGVATSPSPEPTPTTPEPALLPSAPAGPWRDGSSTTAWTIALAVLGCALAGLVVWGFARRRPLGRPAAPTAAVPVAGGPAPDGLADAVDAGARALRSADDPRAAVIACYAAMEDVLTEAGAAPRRSDTSAEVLARASGAGLGGLDAAAALTRLFRDAAYSVHPITERDRARALDALGALNPRRAGGAG